MISVLFARKDSIYKSFNCDVWDIDRDAKNFTGPGPVICHPPCRAWGQLANFSKPRPGEKELAIWAIEQVRKFGGVLEHPAASKLWPWLNLPTGSKKDIYGGFTLSVDQSWFGHRARKRTFLYIVGVEPANIPPYPLSFDTVTRCIGAMGTKKEFTGRARAWKKEVSHKEREATPEKFARWLLDLAELCKPGKMCNF